MVYIYKARYDSVITDYSADEPRNVVITESKSEYAW